MEPHASVGVRVSAIGILQSCLHPGDQTVRAGFRSLALQESLHSVFDGAGRAQVRTIADLDSFGTLPGEELRLQTCDICVIGTCGTIRCKR